MLGPSSERPVRFVVDSKGGGTGRGHKRRCLASFGSPAVLFQPLREWDRAPDGFDVARRDGLVHDPASPGRAGAVVGHKGDELNGTA